MFNRLLTGITFLTLSIAPIQSLAESRDLPSLGDRSSSVISLGQERALGQDFLRSLRSQVPTEGDPILKDYLEQIVYSLAEHSQVKDKRFELVIIKSKELNAFAAPGGIIGVNLGLFLHAETQHELASILAHELAHLSQRHYARQIDAGRSQTIVAMAGLLASVVLIATTGTDAGMAAMTTAQAAAADSALRYSRGRETEADRVGIDTLTDADMDPRAMAYMFEKLSRINRMRGEQIPEFLLTHPVSRVRVADAYNQTRDQPLKTWPLNLDYQLMRVRVQNLIEPSPQQIIKDMQAGLQHADPVRSAASRYGLVLAYTRAADEYMALKHLNILKNEYPGKIAWTIAEAEIYQKAEKFNLATELLSEGVLLNPDNYPLTMEYAGALVRDNKATEAEQVLVEQSFHRPTDADLWYLLAETYGLANNIAGVHQARAEYFVLNGNLDQAIKQLEYALPITRDDYQQNAKIVQRMRDIHQLRRKRL